MLIFKGKPKNGPVYHATLKGIKVVPYNRYAPEMNPSISAHPSKGLLRTAAPREWQQRPSQHRCCQEPGPQQLRCNKGKSAHTLAAITAGFSLSLSLYILYQSEGVFSEQDIWSLCVLNLLPYHSPLSTPLTGFAEIDGSIFGAIIQAVMRVCLLGQV